MPPKSRRCRHFAAAQRTMPQRTATYEEENKATEQNMAMA